MVIIHRQPGPDEKFKKRFAFTAEEKKRVLEDGRVTYEQLTPADVDRAAELVHELIYPATEAKPLSIVEVYGKFSEPKPECFVAAHLLVLAYPRWKAEGKVGEKITDGTQTFISRDMDSDGQEMFRTQIRTDDGFMWVIPSDD